jgi:sugar/nucleoside kinase (ribokinase family)
VIEPTDTTGAGDAFNAGLVSALAAGRDWPDALTAATGLASSLLARPSNDRHTVRG